MHRSAIRLVVVCTVLLAAALACVLPGTQPEANQAVPPTSSSALQTFESTQTPEHTATVVSPRTLTANARLATVTPQRLTLRPSSTPGPSVTPPRQATGKNETPVVSKCDHYALIKDVTIPDGTFMTKNTKFTKTWRLKNTGTCVWLHDYEIYFESGDALVGPDSVKIKTNVLPGETIDISIDLAAPDQTGMFRSYYKMRNSKGEIFGSGDENKPFYLEIWVGNTGAPNLRFDLLGFFCEAEWSVDGQPIPCQGKDSSQGFVRIMNNGRLRGGYKENEAILLSAPAHENGSIIRGRYPDLKILSGDHFMTVMACESEYTRCEVTFNLDYQIGDEGPIQNFAHWDVKYDQELQVADISLAELAGQKVHLILTVIARNNSQGDNRGMWVKPRIMYVRPSATVTPTPTP